MTRLLDPVLKGQMGSTGFRQVNNFERGHLDLNDSLRLFKGLTPAFELPFERDKR